MDTTYLILVKKAVPGSKMAPDEIRAHVAHLVELEGRGELVCAGPFDDGTGGVIVIRAESEEAARASIESDPFVANGSHTIEIRPFQHSHAGNNHLGWGPTQR